MLKSENAVGLKKEIVEIEDQTMIERTVYSRDIERDTNDPSKHHWHVVGDIDSLLMAESFEMNRNNNNYIKKPDKNVDIIEELIKEIDDEQTSLSIIFDNKTQGYPYHYIIVT